MRASVLLLSLAALSACGGSGARALFNVSYEATGELFRDLDGRFAADWQRRHGERLAIRQSLGGSAKQARAVLEGLPADVVALALAYDIDVLAQDGLLSADWQARWPDKSSPFTSTVVLVVRAGNPKHIHDWADLARDDVAVVTPNPKTSGAARWSYLAAWGYGLRHGGEQAARALVAGIYRHAAALDPDGRAAITSFAVRELGDVLVAWESDALWLTEQIAPGRFERIVPSASILAEPPVAVVDESVDRRGTRAAAEAFVAYLYSHEGQEAIARHGFRPRDRAIMARQRQRFAALELFTVDGLFGGWTTAQREHFADGATFDQVTIGSVAP